LRKKRAFVSCAGGFGMKLKKVYNRDDARKETGVGVNAESTRYTFVYCEQNVRKTDVLLLI
jgi:hypothetical protein